MKIYRFGRILKNLRKDRGDTQADLAKYLGISRSAISMYESGEREPNFGTLEAIADYFNVNMNFLLGQTEDPCDCESNPNNRLEMEALDNKKESVQMDSLIEEKKTKSGVCSIRCLRSSKMRYYLKDTESFLEKSRR